ncbi:MAG TPA: SIMPL domain-containing protein [Roseiflexaceae bacterium]|nr:SIMPL domain-containing protein [Roseiflexaceae bacterium]
MTRRILGTAGVVAAVLNLMLLAWLLGSLSTLTATAQTSTPATGSQSSTVDLSPLTSELTKLNSQVATIGGQTGQLVTSAGTLTTQSENSLKRLVSLDEATQRIDARIRMRLISAVGYAEVKANPDTATARIDVKSEAATMEVAMSQNKGLVGRVLAQLAAAGVQGKDIQSADPEIAPVLGDDRKIKGYRVISPLLIKIAKPKESGAKQLEQVIKLGGSDFKEVKFSNASPQATQSQAREQAIRAARSQAEQYAKLAGGTLGQIQEISEDLNVKTNRVPLPDDPSEQVLTAEVRITFELK